MSAVVEWLRGVHEAEKHAALAEQHDDRDEGGYYACPAVRTEPFGDLPFGGSECTCGIARRRAARLARVAAERLLLDDHAADAYRPDDPECSTCTSGNSCGCCSVSEAWPCPPWRIIASGWSHMPGYRDEWRYEP